MRNEFTYTLWKAKKDSKARFVPLNDVPKTGYMGVYNIRESDTQGLEDHGLAAFKGVVHSKYLWIDCDTDEACRDTEKRLKELELYYEKYSTGNRGAHYQLVRDVSPSHLLPQWDRSWVKAFLPKADLSLYTHTHIIRVEGATHEKTGLKKESIQVVDGNGLMFPEDLPSVIDTKPSTDVPVGSFHCVFNDVFLMSKTVPIRQEEGPRRQWFCSIAARLYDLGQDFDFTLGWLTNLNLMTSPMLPEVDVRRIAEWAYSRN